MTLIRYLHVVYKKHKYTWLCVCLVVIMFQITSLPNIIRLLFKENGAGPHVNIYVVYNRPVITEQYHNDVKNNSGQILANKYKKFNYLIAEVDDSSPQKYISETLNFSYSCDQMHRSSSFSTYESILPKQETPAYRGYIAVLGVGQELSQCTKHLLALCLYASTGRRMVVAPRMAGGRMGMKGVPFENFFNISRLNKQLLRFGYSELASEEEFTRNCGDERKTVVFVSYGNPAAKALKARDKNTLYEKVLKHGWINCTGMNARLPPLFNKNKDANDVYCIHENLFGDIQSFNEKILRDSKCVVINQWNQLYNVHWNNIMRPSVPDAQAVQHFYLDPSSQIVDEVNTFRSLRIQRPYIGIHVRGQRFKNQSFLHPCFDIALEFVNALKRSRNVKTVFLSTDMSEFGGILNKDKNSHQLFAEKSGAVVYDPKVTKKLNVLDRWMVSLAEVRLLTQSDHLVTVGQGSFGAFIRARYLWERETTDNTWTLTTVCRKTAARYF